MVQFKKLPLLDLLPIPSSIEYISDDVKLPPLQNKRRFSQIIYIYLSVDYYLKIRKKDRSELAETSASASNASHASHASQNTCPCGSLAESKGLPTGMSKRDLKRHQKAMACETNFVKPRNDGHITSSISKNDSERPISDSFASSVPGSACTLQTAATDYAEGALNASDRSSNKKDRESNENPVTIKKN